jgi:succinyl-CoA synthetase beta subunit
MRLLECEAKARLAARGLPVPAGCLWPAVPRSAGGFVVKAQVATGGRGKSGGILFAAGEEDVQAAAARLDAQFGRAAPAFRVYVEERLSIARELYLAVLVDRDSRGYALLASPDGGIDVEGTPRHRVLKQLIDPLLGLRDYAIRRLHAFLGLDDADREAFASAVRALVAGAVAEDAQLIEINPLALTGDGRFVAADARMIVDDNARWRHPDWRSLALAEEGSAVDRRVAAAGATGVEVDPAGALVGVVSGAGLMMATLDWLVAAGARVRYMIDLGGTPLADRRGLVPVFAALAELNPAVVFVNAYFQTARADDFAQAILEAHDARPITSRVVVRLKGREAAAARLALAPLGFEIHERLADGLRAAARVAARAIQVT